MVLIGTKFVEKVFLCNESVNLNLEENLTDVLLLLYGSPIPDTIVATMPTAPCTAGSIRESVAKYNFSCRKKKEALIFTWSYLKYQQGAGEEPEDSTTRNQELKDEEKYGSL